MKYREAARKLEALGCEELPRRGGGSHRKWFNPDTQQATVLPDWEVGILSLEHCDRQFAN